VKRIYHTGKKVAEGFKESMRILFDKTLGQWNYRAVPLQNEFWRTYSLSDP